MSVNYLTNILNRVAGARGTMPLREVSPAQYKINTELAGKTTLMTPEHRDLCNASLLGDAVNGKSLYYLA